MGHRSLAGPTPPDGLAEMFGGVTIIEAPSKVGEVDVDTQFKKFLPRIKQAFTKFLVLHKTQ
jgi:hypothetical protein